MRDSIVSRAESVKSKNPLNRGTTLNHEPVKRNTILNLNDNQLQNYGGKNADKSKILQLIILIEEATKRLMATLIEDDDRQGERLI